MARVSSLPALCLLWPSCCPHGVWPAPQLPHSYRTGSHQRGPHHIPVISSLEGSLLLLQEPLFRAHGPAAYRCPCTCCQPLILDADEVRKRLIRVGAAQAEGSPGCFSQRFPAPGPALRSTLHRAPDEQVKTEEGADDAAPPIYQEHIGEGAGNGEACQASHSQWLCACSVIIGLGAF